MITAADATHTAARYSYRLRSPFCTKQLGHSTPTTGPQQIHSISTTSTTNPHLVVQQIHNKGIKPKLHVYDLL